MDNNKILSVKEVLELELNIPNYQRPYKRTEKNVNQLLEDIEEAIKNSFYVKYDSFKYRIGTIILHNYEGKLDIVDGQQRLITLSLIKIVLENEFPKILSNNEFSSLSAINIHKNYNVIKEWFKKITNEVKEKWIAAFQDILEVIEIEVDDLSSAFQLFDSQNTRGKTLDPHDLLKAFHLREMRNDIHDMYNSTKKWESHASQSIKILFEDYLFPIYHWIDKEKSTRFKISDIDTFKGININSTYVYAIRAFKSSPNYQIGEPFISGKDFFLMVEHYLELLNNLNNEIEENESFCSLKEIINDKNYNIHRGFVYSYILFKCAALYYVDKFNNYDEKAIKNIFLWAFMLRCDLKVLNYESVNKYATIETYQVAERYTNKIPLFYYIRKARFHNEISNLVVNTKQDKDNPNRNGLRKKLDSINKGE